MSFFSIENAEVVFGGLRAVAGVNIALEKGRIHGLIGPNGAGKTTLVNAISGLVPLTSGRISLDGRPISGLRPHSIAGSGVSRTFQHAEIFPDLTVMRNVMAGTYAHRRSNVLQDFFGTTAKAAEEQRAAADSTAVLEEFGLINLADSVAGDLPFGILKKLDLARAMVAQPRVLMLDEPVSGMNAGEALDVIRTCRRLAQELGVTLLIIEHNMRFIMELAEKIFVLDHGEKIAEGSPQEIQRNPKVIEAYLGRSGSTRA